MTLETINPATGEHVRSYDEAGDAQVQQALTHAQGAFESWRTSSFHHRSSLMKRAATTLRSNKEKYAAIMTEEVGKPITQSLAEIEKCAWACEYYAENAEAFLKNEEVVTDATKSYVSYEPLGIILAIMPWNFPFWQVFRFAAPALMAGNVGVLKHASNCQGSALAIEEVFKESGFPMGTFTNLAISSSRVDALIRDKRVKAVTLTGSEAAGMHVARVAGQEIKKTVLELGGSDPFVVFADANVDEAAKVAALARTINSGQSCIAAKRFIVVESVLAQFEESLKRQLCELKVGDPTDPATQVGPLAREDLIDELDRQVKETVKQGAQLVLGGKRLDMPGSFYAVTLLSGVRKGMPAFDQETFGPVAALVPAKDEEEAISLANHPHFGLGASIWTRDLGRAGRIASRIEAGAVFVNGLVKSDPRLPFGGIKRSGYGRELSHHGIKEFVNVKSVWMKF